MNIADCPRLSPSLTIHVSRRAGNNESTARGRYLNRGCAAYNKTKQRREGAWKWPRDEGREVVERIIARERGIIKVAGVGWRHDWPVSPISPEEIDERTTMHRQGAFVTSKYIIREEFSVKLLFVDSRRELNRFVKRRKTILRRFFLIFTYVFQVWRSKLPLQSCKMLIWARRWARAIYWKSINKKVLISL